MRVCIAIAILTGILFQSTAKLAILINFRANREYIAKNLCVNRKKPKSCCKGSCQLNKQLQEEDKKENKGLPPGLKDKFNLLTCTIPEKEEQHFEEITTAPVFIYGNNYDYSLSGSVFHPPDQLT
ncbi:MAG: hypothetical protein K0S33_1090 [Bacteroidetes bacterium]|jgi:hypothetical protein|nr:hypothetical protein [Bacteroidota bacterium]